MPSRKKSSPPTIDPKYACFGLRIDRSTIHRWGVYADEPIPVGKKIIEYTGERINRRETKRRSDESGTLHYMFTLDPYWTLDGRVGGSGAEYINHSCDPNVYAWVTRGHILYMCKRPVAKNEELTIDYHFAKNVEKVACKCGAKTCRGTINIK
jgi:uncharacterized protein